MDFAIVEIGGKQFKINPNSTLELDKLTLKVGDKLNIDKVLMTVDGDKTEIGTPYLNGVSFEAEVLEQKKDKKINILRFKSKSRYRRRGGFRQSITKVSLAPKTAVKKVAVSKAAPKKAVKKASEK